MGSEVANCLAGEDYSLLAKEGINTVDILDMLEIGDLHRAGFPLGSVYLLMQGLTFCPPLATVLSQAVMPVMAEQGTVLEQTRHRLKLPRRPMIL